MEELISFQQELLSQLSDNKRYLLQKINWSNRLIGIKGARGTGKTILLLQRIKFHLLTDSKTEALYVTLDDLYFLENTVVDLAREFTLKGGTHLFLDEVHKYPRWSRELKLIYDKHPKLNIIFTSSSMLEIYKGESDLSRRAVTYHLNELSFREFIYFEQNKELPVFSLEEIIGNHSEIAQEIRKELPVPVKHFQNYLNYGAYPYYNEGVDVYLGKLLQTLNLIVETDMNVVENIPYEESRKIKKLLVAISQSAPFTPNISKLSERLGMNRKFLISAIKLLDRADLVMEFYKPAKGIGAFTKPEKLYLHNTNLIYALGKNNAEKGALRETFFANQLRNVHEIHLAEKGDFLIDGKYTFEVGGKGKDSKQIKGVQNSFIVRDDMEVGAMNIIPLWLFGFLY
jgi:hypothetical protein